MSLQNGRKGRLYVITEAGSGGGNAAGYGQIQDGSNGANTLSAAAAALRHINFKATYDPFNRSNSTEKKTSPGQVVTLDRRASGSLDTLVGLLRPSGTLGTSPEANAILTAALGATHKAALVTTINDASATTTSCTFTAVTGLTVGDPILFVISGKKYARFVTNIASLVVTWAPALPSAPANSSAVKSGIGYKLTTDLAISLAMLHCLPNYRREYRGIGIDKLALAYDANAEVQFTASGPLQTEVTDANAVADPSSFTSVGGNPPSGIVGETYIAGTSYLMKKAGINLTNGLMLRNAELGANSDTGLPTEVYRSGRRAVAISLDAFVETAATLHDPALAGTVKSFFNQTGRTEGNILAAYCPQVYWKVPETDDPDAAASWSFKGTALESSDGANDELYLGIL